MIDKKDLENLYDNAYLIGTPNDGTECIFNYSNVGAMTICKTDEFIIQSKFLINIKNTIHIQSHKQELRN